MFYVLASEMELILQYTDDLLNGVLIPSST